LLAAVALAAPPDEPITKKNWSAHPKIAAIRALVQQNEDAIKAKQYQHQERSDCQMEGAGSESESIDRDGSGVIRKYVHEVGSDDSAYKAEAQYDERGRLRFVFARRGAVNGSQGEFRIYLGEDGKKIWTDVKQKGPGYTWLPDFPERWLEKDPEHAWKNPPPCE
jgi:hypothetical protein